MNKLFEEKFRGKKVFITGHTGFKGAWLATWLQTLGAKVKGFSLEPEENSLFLSISKKLNCETVFSDVRNKENLESEILNFKPDFIFHLAAQSLVRRSYTNPLETFETNILGTANLLYSLLKLKKECAAVIITTDKVYDNKEWIYPYRENDELGGYDPYSASKASAEIITGSMRKSFFHVDKLGEHKKAISTARAGNVIGGGDYAEDRIIPDIVRAIKNDKKIILRNPDSVRPWQHVLDPLSGYLLLAIKMSENAVKFSGSYNFGPALESNLSVKDLADTAVKFFGKGKIEISKDKNQPHEAGILRLDISKALLELGWSPKWDSKTAIEKTINWYKNSLVKDADIFELCLNDIKAFT